MHVLIASAGAGTHAFRPSGRGFHSYGRGFGGHHLFFFGGGGGGGLFVLLILVLLVVFLLRNRSGR